MAKNKQKKIIVKNKFINSGFEKKSKDGSFMIFGRKPIFEQIENFPGKVKKLFIIDNSLETLEIKKIHDFAKDKKITIENINSKTAITKIGKVNHQGIAAQVAKFEYFDQLDWEIGIRKSKKNNLVLVLDKIEDVGNFGAIIRSAAACGVSAIFVSGDKQAPVNGTVFKTSAGNISKVKIVKVVNVGQIVKKLKDLKFWTYAIDMPENADKGGLWDQKFDSNTALVLGGESDGVSLKVREACDFIMPIPMENGVESLNVSVSGAIAMYEWKRQQN
jgi:23S rRNA (guanosine2251-2'-O)-methyltransferase